MILTIKNKAELDVWLNARMCLGHGFSAIKGAPPHGATYDDGDPIMHDVNVAWIDDVTGERFDIVYCFDDLGGKEE